MKKTIFIVIAGILLLILLIPIGGFLYLNHIFLPKQIKPQIIKAVSAATGYDVSLGKIYLNLDGAVIGEKFTLQEKGAKKAFLSLDNLWLKPDYGKLPAVLKGGQSELPLRISINRVGLESPQGTLSADFGITAYVRPDRKNPAASAFRGTLKIIRLECLNLPIVKSLKNVQGEIAFDQQQISSKEIKGFIYGIVPLQVSFQLDDYLTAPKLRLASAVMQLNLLVNAEKQNNDLLIHEFKAGLANTHFMLHGKVADLTAPYLDLELDLSFLLEDLKNIPLLPADLKKLNLKGNIAAQAKIQGQAKDPDKLSLALSLDAPRLEIDKTVISNINLRGLCQDKKIKLDKISAEVFGSRISGEATLDLTVKNLPYALTLNITDCGLKPVLESAGVKDLALEGMVNSRIKISGEALKTDYANIQAEMSLDKGSFNKQLFPQVTASAEMIYKGTSLEIAGLNAACRDIALKLSGRIDALNTEPNLTTTGTLKLPLEDLSYLPLGLESMLNQLRLKGTLNTGFSAKLLFKNPQALAANLEVTAPKLQVQQYALENLKANCSLKDQKVNISQLNAVFCSGEIAAAATIGLDNKKFPVKGNLEVQHLGLAPLLEVVNASQPAAIKAAISGQVDFEGDCLPVIDLSADCHLMLKDILLKDTAMTDTELISRVGWHDRDLEIKTFSLQNQELSVNGQGSLKDISRPIADFTLNAALPLEKLYPLVAALQPGLPPLSLNGTVMAEARVIGPLTDYLALDVETALNSQHIVINQFVVSDISGKIILREGLLSAEPLSLIAYNGALQGDFHMKLTEKNYPFHAAARLDGFFLQELNQKARLTDKEIRGIVSASTDLNGEGADLNKIVGKAAVQLGQAKLYDLEMFSAIASILGISWLNRIDISEGEGTFTIANGAATTRDLSLRGKDVIITTEGSIGFNQEMNLLSSIRLLGEAARQSQSSVLGGVLVNPDGTLNTQIEIKGLLTKPIIRPKISEQKIQNIMEDALRGFIFKKLPAPPASGK